MFVGHIGVALASKKIAPKVSLPVLILAAQLLDIVWAILLMAGVENARIVPGFNLVSPLDYYDFPWSHSLLAAAVLAALFGAAYILLGNESWGGWVLAALVLSHWPLDFIVHRSDLLLYPGGDDRYGLGLWNSLEQTMLVEGAIFLAGVLIYHGATKASDRAGSYGFWSLALLLLLAWTGSLVGPPPPSITAVVWTNLLSTLVIVAWATWVDRHRWSPL